MMTRESLPVIVSVTLNLVDTIVNGAAHFANLAGWVVGVHAEYFERNQDLEGSGSDVET